MNACLARPSLSALKYNSWTQHLRIIFLQKCAHSARDYVWVCVANTCGWCPNSKCFSWHSALISARMISLQAVGGTKFRCCILLSYIHTLAKLIRVVRVGRECFRTSKNIAHIGEKHTIKLNELCALPRRNVAHRLPYSANVSNSQKDECGRKHRPKLPRPICRNVLTVIVMNERTRACVDKRSANIARIASYPAGNTSGKDAQ